MSEFEKTVFITTQKEADRPNNNAINIIGRIAEIHQLLVAGEISPTEAISKSHGYCEGFTRLMKIGSKK